MRGTATLERDGASSALANGAELGTGDWIATDAGARVKLRFADGSTVQLGENSRLRIDLAKFDEGKGRRNILLDLPLGLLRATAAKLTSTSGSSFEIHTGIGYSAVRGTQWIMEAASEETRVYVQEGRVSVGPDFPSTQFPKLVEAGYWVVVRKTGIETIEAAPPGLVDSLIDQTEASLTDGAPADAETAETAETEDNAVSNATGAANDLPGSVVDPEGSGGSATTSATASGGAASATGDADSAADGGSASSSSSNNSPNNSPNGGSSSSSGGGNGGGGSSKAGGGGSLSGGSNKGSNKSGLGGSNKLK